MVYAEFENLLKQAMGLDAASIGASAIERAVQERQSACKLQNPQAYWEHVHASANELQELIEAVIVPETWFFRDREAYAALARMVYENWLRTHAEGVLRLLSLPCSTGEEPYSMAMTLLDAGFPDNRFRVDAVDISARALTHARRAIYGKNSFRGNALEFRDRHFEVTAHGHRLSEAVRRQVHFQHGNLFDAGFLPGVEIYDVIFCRNVLIYFDRATQDRTIKVLDRLLSAQGILFVAPSETGLLISHDFVSAKVPLAFAFFKGNATPPAPKPRASPVKPPVHKPVSAPRAAARATAVKPASVPAPQAPATAAAGIEQASRLADQGKLAEAATACEAHLRLHGPSAQAFHLLGLVSDASGNLPAAAHYYRKALYLDPKHHEALLHLACLAEKQGNAADAKVLLDRARRLHQGQK